MDLMAVLADPVRREILEQLRAAPLAAGAIANLFGISRPAISRHVRVLRDAGLVLETDDGNAAGDGRTRVYRLDPRPLREVDRWLATFRPAWTSARDALETEVYRTRRDRQRRTAAPPSSTTRSSA